MIFGFILYQSKTQIKYDLLNSKQNYKNKKKIRKVLLILRRNSTCHNRIKNLRLSTDFPSIFELFHTLFVEFLLSKASRHSNIYFLFFSWLYSPNKWLHQQFIFLSKSKGKNWEVWVQEDNGENLWIFSDWDGDSVNFHFALNLLPYCLVLSRILLGIESYCLYWDWGKYNDWVKWVKNWEQWVFFVRDRWLAFYCMSWMFFL